MIKPAYPRGPLVSLRPAEAAKREAPVDPSTAPPYNEAATAKAWERFVTSREASTAGLPVRGVIQRSWERSVRLGVDAHGRGSDVILSPEELGRIRKGKADLLSIAGVTFARVAELLADTSTMVVITDDEGTIIEAGGDPRTMDDAHDIRLEIGAKWCEGSAGTNGIGTALSSGAPVYVRAAEHFCEGVKAWTCIGTPIRSPLDGSIIGVIDFSGPRDIFQRHNVALGMMAASHIELGLADRMRIERMQLLELCLGRLRVGPQSDGYVLLDRFGRVIHHSPCAPRRWQERNPGVDLKIGARLVDFDDAQWPDTLGKPAAGGLDLEGFERLVCDGAFSGAMVVLGPHVRARRAAPAAPSIRPAPGEALLAARAAIIGDSETLIEAIERTERAAHGRSSILLEGETGVGKELFARLIHAASQESGKEPFVAFNCGAVSKELLGAELFGHAPGSFTGATREGRAGRFEVADGGVLSLDEIGEMPLDLQPYLLRVLEEKAVYRIGESKPRPFNVRLVASTNRNLRQEAAEGRFRKDLYFRIGAVKIIIPPLRARQGDVARLVEHFSREIASGYDMEPPVFEPAVLDLLERYGWPGNVRELRNLVESMVLMARSRVVGLDDFPEDFAAELHELEAELAPGTSMAASEPVQRIDATERQLIEKAMAATGGNTSLAADRLGIARSTLYRKLHQYRTGR
ncbi:sigma-54-dependent Fis family transcriptional regulator [Ancylobacter amanitiformis]|uniref:Transcriptional regulator of acetoin/glycerol metabolism n=1 Tax=Ancylobacter amanitiformis TaxID=217069 RepID=A0ABU0LMH4_9HYPH|nr:sigma-54-dependent Fis family transcriptional regulator [Ancylobacter amanitiformis]MDQ0509900.1 transcriptional regulator of acetoin/glycerol metabolism [Ancylobacter amanitiformis]